MLRVLPAGSQADREEEIVMIRLEPLYALLSEFREARRGPRGQLTRRSAELYASGAEALIHFTDTHLPVNGGRPVEVGDLTATGVEEFVQDQLSRGVALASVNMALQGVRTFSWWLSNSGRGPNFAAGVQYLRPRPPDPRG